jgi:RNA polymerase sigma factor for flagellar operon FliA
MFVVMHEQAMVSAFTVSMPVSAMSARAHAHATAPSPVSTSTASGAPNYDRLLAFARAVASDYARRASRVDLQELISAGYFGLADAIRLHGTAAAADFEMLAKCRIRGAIRDELRRRDLVPRRERQRLREATRIEEKLTGELGRAPEAREVAKSLGITPSDFSELRAQPTLREISYEAATADGPGSEPATRASLAPDMMADQRGRARRVHEALPILSARDQNVLRGLYVEGRTLREIGTELGLTEARISQIHSAALRRIREAVGD